MKKILIIGAGIEQVESIKMAREMGHYVITSDMNLSAPGVKYADKAYEYSTTDSKGNISLAQKEGIDGVMTVCSETAVPTVAAVAEALHLPGFKMDTALKATNKAEMRKAFAEYRVPVSEYVVTDQFSMALDFTKKNPGPWIIKPVDSSGQRGTFILYEQSNLEKAFEQAVLFSNSAQVLLDRYVSGPEIHVTMFVIDNEIHFLALSDRITLSNEYFGIAVRHIGPSLIDEKTEQSIKDVCCKAVKSIGLENGVATCELILKDERPVIMEIAVRVPGGYLREVAMHLSGVDIVRATIWNCLGEKRSFDEMITEPKHRAVSVKFITGLNVPVGIDRVESLEIPKEKDLPCHYCRFHHELPFELPKLSSSVGRFGVVITAGNSRAEALDASEAVFAGLRVNNKQLVDYEGLVYKR